MNKNLVLVLCGIFFILSSLGLYKLVGDSDAHFDLDSCGYDRIGKYYAQTDMLIDPSRGPVIPVQALGYPLFLGIIYKIFGQYISYVIIIQVLLSLFALYLLYCIALALFDESVALVVTVLGSINLGFLVYSQFILTEIVLTTLLIGGFERLVHYFKKHSYKALGQAGLWYGLSVAVKPVALFYVFILFFFIALFSYLHSRPIAKSLVLFFCCFYAPVMSYMIHNKLQFGIFAVAPVMHENIYFYFLAKIIARNEGISWQGGLEKVGGLMEKKDHNDPSRWDAPKKMMHSFFWEQPFLVIKLWLLNVIKTFGGLYSSQLKFLINPSLKGTETSFFSKNGSIVDRFYAYLTDGVNNRFVHVIAFWQLVWSFLQYIFVTLALLVLLHERRYFFVSFVVTSIAYFAFITGHDGCARYRMMFEYFFILFAAFGIVLVYRWLCKNKKIVQYQLTC